jgi:undecaprenyl pyrophosphate phosphatase UppP
MFLNINFLVTFDFYALFVLIICTYCIVKNYSKEDIWIILGFILQVIGGLIMLFNINGHILDHNGIYHMFMVMTLMCIFIGLSKKNNKKVRNS